MGSKVAKDSRLSRAALTAAKRDTLAVFTAAPLPMDIDRARSYRHAVDDGLMRLEDVPEAYRAYAAA